MCPVPIVSRSAVLAALVLALVLVGSAPARPAASPPSWASLHRELRARPLPAGAACPVSPVHALDRRRLRGIGAGPVYPAGGVTSFGPDDRHPAWLAAKTIWTWPAGLITNGMRVLVRGARLDRSGAMRFQLGPEWGAAPLTRELRLDTRHTVGSFSNSTWGTTVTLLFVREAGCYLLQLDSARGTSTVVIRAARS